MTPINPSLFDPELLALYLELDKIAALSYFEKSYDIN